MLKEKKGMQKKQKLSKRKEKITIIINFFLLKRKEKYLIFPIKKKIDFGGRPGPPPNSLVFIVVLSDFRQK